MISIRKSSDRGHFNHGWLDTYHTFSFGRYNDLKHVHFRTLRVINEDRVAPGAGFGEHPHDNMEIVTYVVSGTLAHKDSAGNVGTLGPGDVQRMSAGRGIFHSEFNGSKTDPVHLLQIWIFPAEKDIEPGHEQGNFSTARDRNRLRPIVTPDKAEGSLRIHQDARVYAATIDAGRQVQHTLGSRRHAWVQVIRGTLTLNGQTLSAGDGAGVSDEPSITLAAAEESELLLFDLA
jgi:redox-sensitive bicupin YhaK (pirin superfamily)